ncbi:spindle pole body protein Spc24 [Schizosaccharomyces japonicus yFS275]|uniref:Kinetochore protein Spc24 n=1 Tax=Schizosaccharomyces japonicus (strain yFS275 / FY16936) TaxID=402676 RepID=B6K192_SCHJY|nr:spindle pole body protein Spc24 [Schizosaccharomyces japonicus yFS275]EEB07713.1 spindle pole body protein Spc24 [Schizosaccharomyces japonicus yFS275]
METDNPIELIQSTLAGFQIGPDLKSLAHIQIAKEEISKHRQQQLQDSVSLLKALSRKLEVSAQTLVSLENSSRENDHEKAVVSLDRRRFQLAKAINDTETEIMSLESTLQNIKTQLLELEETPKKSQEASEDDATLLKLQCYRSLGIELMEDETTGGRKAIIHTDKKISVVQITQKNDPFFYSNRLWELLYEQNTES